MTWPEFIRTHRHGLFAVDFFTVETMWLERLHVLFFIELGGRRAHLAGCTANPSALARWWDPATRPDSVG
jgi:putative transposase